jgi:hypothetical protein
MDTALERFSSALVTRMNEDPGLLLQVASGAHRALQSGGFDSAGVTALIKQVGKGDEGGGGGGGRVTAPPPSGPVGPASGGESTDTAQPITVEAFWWGFHFVIPHDALHSILIGGNAVNTFVELLGPETGPAAPFVEIAAALVGKMLDIMRDMDVGNGIYFSMTWIAPGVFVPTPR